LLSLPSSPSIPLLPQGEGGGGAKPAIEVIKG